MCFNQPVCARFDTPNPNGGTVASRRKFGRAVIVFVELRGYVVLCFVVFDRRARVFRVLVVLIDLELGACQCIVLSINFVKYEVYLPHVIVEVEGRYGIVSFF